MKTGKFIDIWPRALKFLHNSNSDRDFDEIEFISVLNNIDYHAALMLSEDDLDFGEIYSELNQLLQIYSISEPEKSKKRTFEFKGKNYEFKAVEGVEYKLGHFAYIKALQRKKEAKNRTQEVLTAYENLKRGDVMSDADRDIINLFHVNSMHELFNDLDLIAAVAIQPIVMPDSLPDESVFNQIKSELQHKEIDTIYNIAFFLFQKLTAFQINLTSSLMRGVLNQGFWLSLKTRSKLKI